MPEIEWYRKPLFEVLSVLGSDESGLSAEEAGARLRSGGMNVLPEAKSESLAGIFLRQFMSPLIYILVGASVIIFFLGQAADGAIILAVLLFNAIVGTIQEGRAQNTLKALRHFVETRGTVRRAGVEVIVPDREIVPGDLMVLHEGEKVPADARLLMSHNLVVDEAALTGESEASEKHFDGALEAGLPVPSQSTMVWKGTNIVAGNGVAIVVATGPKTEIGRIAHEVATEDVEIPLQVNIRYLSRAIIVVVAALCITLFFFGISLGLPGVQMFATVVSLAVSVIPEGLPIVMTLILATGVWRMGKRNALVKRLQAVEALGQARVIAVDKTGTITKNEIVVQKVSVAGKTFDIGGVGYEPKGATRLGGVTIEPVNHPELLLVGKIAAYASGARVLYSEEERRWRVAGDPTEAALQVFSQKLGYHKEELERESPLLAEIPFDSRQKYHATIHKEGAENVLSVVGAAEVILSRSSKVWRSGRSYGLSTEEKRAIQELFLEWSRSGLRVVAAAERREAPLEIRSEDIRALTFVGLLGMKDGLRPEVHDALKKALDADIQVVMMTGDHVETAQAIAHEAGILRDGRVLQGSDIDAFSDEALAHALDSVSVFARVTPEHKLRIIKAYRDRGQIVAMTGDGVNDAPSLVAADLGVAMGGIGTEVAKEAADIVLLDDNFGSIISAVEEGRSIYKTMKKVILYLFSTGAGEAFTILGALFVGFPLPILPAQIIWLNFVTDSFLDVALGMEPKESGLLDRTFEHPKKYLMDRLSIVRMVLMALPMAVGALILFDTYTLEGFAKASTVAMCALAIFQWFNAWNCRSETESLFHLNPFANLFLVLATLVVVGLQLIAVYHPLAQSILHTVPLSIHDWLIIVPVAASIVVIEEVRKYFMRRF